MKKIIKIALIALLVFNVTIFIIRPYDILSFIITTISILLSYATLYIPTSYEFHFNKNDWKEAENEMRLLIPYEIHNMGKAVTCALYECNDQDIYEQVYADIFINDGDIVIKIGYNASFKGKVVITS